MPTQGSPKLMLLELNEHNCFPWHLFRNFITDHCIFARIKTLIYDLLSPHDGFNITPACTGWIHLTTVDVIFPILAFGVVHPSIVCVLNVEEEVFGAAQDVMITLTGNVNLKKLLNYTIFFPV